MTPSIIPQKQCTKCKQSYPATNEYFWADKSRVCGLKERCKNCTNKPKPEPVPSGMKRCSQCKCVLRATLDHFHADRTTIDGLTCACKKCRNDKTQGYYIEHAEYKRQSRRKRYAANPQPELDYRNANKDKAVLASKRHYLKTRNEKLVKQKQNRKDNPTHFRELEKRSRLKHPEKSHNRRIRFKDAEGTFTKADIDLLFKTQKGLCWWCEKKLGKYHIDHRIALSRGGTNWPNNLCLACRECNLSKNNKMPWEWNGRLL